MDALVECKLWFFVRNRIGLFLVALTKTMAYTKKPATILHMGTAILINAFHMELARFIS